MFCLQGCRLLLLVWLELYLQEHGRSLSAKLCVHRTTKAAPTVILDVPLALAAVLDTE